MYASNIKRIPLIKTAFKSINGWIIEICFDFRRNAMRCISPNAIAMCMCMCVCMPRLWTPGNKAYNSDYKFKFGILFSTCSNSNGVK